MGHARAGADQDWAGTYRTLAERDVDALGVEDLDLLAVAAYLTGREAECFDVWERGHHRCAETGDVIGSARFGVRLAQALMFKGDFARTSGWVERLRRQLDDVNLDCVEQGFLENVAAFCRIIETGDIPGARAAFERAGKIGHRFDDQELVTLARLGEGRCLIYSGELEGGLALLDEVMISVEAREISPVAIGDAYCTVIDACNELFDLHRCETWTASFTRWCDKNPDVVLYRGQCLLHRAELLLLHGAWAEARDAVREACVRLADPVSLLTIGGAHYLEGEVHRVRGEVAEAEAAYEQANQLGCQPQPGLARLRLAQGAVDVALGSIRRALGEAEDPISRARLLGTAVEVLLATGDVESAGEHAEELAAVAGELASPLLAAHADHARGAVDLLAGDAASALLALRRAWTGWCDLDIPHEGAQTRLLLADACAAAGDTDSAALERRAAEATLAALGAPPSTASLGSERVASSLGLSVREAEVLRLVAQGKTNRVIAAELFISEKTVASHLGHIFTKVGVTSRSAATAFAYENGLV